MNRHDALNYMENAADRCPYCNADGEHIITKMQEEADGLDHYKYCSCNLCGKEWVERYTLRAVDEHDFRSIWIEAKEQDTGNGYPEVAIWLYLNDEEDPILLEATGRAIGEDPDDDDRYVEYWQDYARANFIDFLDNRPHPPEVDDDLPNILTFAEGLKMLTDLIPIGEEERAQKILLRMGVLEENDEGEND